MEESLTPMTVQYLVGLCCVRRNPDAVEIMLGDMVMDVAALKERDVDVTVTLQEEDGAIRAFKAYEVKGEGTALDVSVVEQLIAKLGETSGRASADAETREGDNRRVVLLSPHASPIFHSTVMTTFPFLCPWST